MSFTFKNNNVITFLTISITYFMFVCMGGFEDILKKYVKVTGTTNLILNSLLFMMLIRLTVDSVPIYLSIFHTISHNMFRRLFQGNVYEGQAENIAELALKMKKENLEDLVKKGFKKHAELTNEDDKNTILVKIDNWQKSIQETNQKLASLSTKG